MASRLKNEQGFTLFEMLLVIAIVSIITCIAVPALYNVYKTVQSEHFFQVLNSDILFAQNQALGELSNIRIIFEERQYIILQGEEPLARRKYPEHIRMNMANPKIQFNNLGTMINPGTYRLYHDDKPYKLVFPLGKGRHYVEE